MELSFLDSLSIHMYLNSAKRLISMSYRIQSYRKGKIKICPYA
jgi:hypothetical protein